MYYVYVIYSKQKKVCYKGYCKDLKKRIQQHLNGRVKSTKSVKDWKLVYYQAFINKSDARREELFLKSGQGRKRIQYLLRETLKIGGVG